MSGPTDYLAIAVSAVSILGCAESSSSQEAIPSLPAMADEVSTIIKSGNLQPLRGLIFEPLNTFDSTSGEIEPGIQCFFIDGARCPPKSGKPREIVLAGSFNYYHHLSGDDVIVNFVREDRREDFLADPDSFLRSRYLKDYFSCRFIRVDGRWLIKESICYSETEGPFTEYYE
ncbi:hypothetical protein [Brevundimonas sp.]|uniref:hypothetical protein n=1 Tax=Brevundimonas sp. TaxID=1871086 RepID=UPI0026217013|nr:hypothetical protein [Brevundimonas sp.]